MDKKLIYLLLHIGKLATDEVRKSLGQNGLHFGQARILLTLLSFNELNQKEISDGLFIKPATVTNLIKKLENAELVNRLRNDKDERIINVTLTQKGNEAARFALKEMEKIEHNLIKRLNDNEIKEIVDPLLKIRDALGGVEPTLLKN